MFVCLYVFTFFCWNTHNKTHYPKQQTKQKPNNKNQSVLPVGDASGIQSPLSFGGLGAMCRHLERLTDALSEALEV